MNDLIERMLDAFHREFEQDGKGFAEGMTAAATVCLDAALGEPTKGDFNARAISNVDAHTFAQVSAVLKIRKARLLAPKTPEERVTVVIRSGGEYFDVEVDGEAQYSFDGCERKQAEIYRRGLIAEMREKG